MARSKKTDRVAVENFLASLSGDSRADFENARADARSYGWSSATLEAVINGIAAHYSRKAMSAHNLEGNCWEHSAVYECDACGAGNMCDVCHEHDSPRGDCADCKRCKDCDDVDTRTP